MPTDRTSRLKARLVRVARDHEESVAVLGTLNAIFGPSRYPAEPDPCEPPPISEEHDPELWTAFRAFKLNPRENVAWWLLAKDMAKMLFPQPGKRGRPKNSRKWSDNARVGLYSMVCRIQDKHPTWKMSQVCTELKKNKLFDGIAQKTLYGLLTKRPKK